MEVSIRDSFLAFTSKYNDPGSCKYCSVRIARLRGRPLNLRFDPPACIEIQNVSIIKIDIALFLSSEIVTLKLYNRLRLPRKRELKLLSMSLNDLHGDWVGHLLSAGKPRTTFSRLDLLIMIKSVIAILCSIMGYGSYACLTDR